MILQIGASATQQLSVLAYSQNLFGLDTDTDLVLGRRFFLQPTASRHRHRRSSPPPPMTHYPGSSPGTAFRPGTAPRTDQLNGTSLKWGSDGELSELDLQRILALLSQADPVAEALVGNRSDSQA